MTEAFVVFFGGGATSPIERRLDDIRLAVAEHVVGIARAAGFAHVLAITPDGSAAARLGAAGAEAAPPSTSPFHLGRELSALVERRALERICAIGGGAGALLTAQDLAAIRARLESASAIVISNNYYSADLVAFAPASALAAIDPPATDNPLPRLLHQQAGLPSFELPRGAASLLDVDTPTDATILRRHPRCPSAARALPGWEDEQGARLETVLRLLATPDVELCIAGRVGAQVWAFIETQSACRVRMLAEERGMQAAGRDVSGQARSVLGLLYEQLGPRAFFERLAELGNAVVLDSRVLFAHLGLRPSAADRFASDVFRIAEIADGRLAEFTRAAVESPVPVLLGGQTLVGGGLWAMVELAWQPAEVG